MRENTLGNSAAAAVLVQMHKEGIISAGGWRKLARTYHHFCFALNEIWMSGMEERFKRTLDLLYYQETVKKVSEFKLHPKARSHLLTVLSTHHKEVVKKQNVRKGIRRGVGNRLHRKTA